MNWLLETAAERQYRELHQTPEGRQAYEDALVRWEQNNPHWPLDSDSNMHDAIVTLVHRQQSKTHRFWNMVAIIFVVFAILYNCGTKAYIRINGDPSGKYMYVD
jgi:hypothetical protein